jgi:hypothetical protein
VILALADAAFAAIGMLVWNAYRDAHLTSTESATFVLLGVSAVTGIGILLLAVIGFVRGGRGRGTAKLASTLAWLRLTGRPVREAPPATLPTGSHPVVPHRHRIQLPTPPTTQRRRPRR